MRIVSLLPAATEIAAALGLMDNIVGVSHECDFSKAANDRPRVTGCPVHNTPLTSREVNEWVRQALRDNGTIYTIDEWLLRSCRRTVFSRRNYVMFAQAVIGLLRRLGQTLRA